MTIPRVIVPQAHLLRERQSGFPEVGDDLLEPRIVVTHLNRQIKPIHEQADDIAVCRRVGLSQELIQNRIKAR